MAAKLNANTSSKLRLLQGKGKKTFDLSEVAQILSLERNKASQLLFRWKKQGWIVGIKRGVYIIANLDEPVEAPLSHPFLLVPELFSQAYVGGWSAVEYWNLTDQIFNTICVITTDLLKTKESQFLNFKFSYKHIIPRKFFGTEMVWIDSCLVVISDPHKTIVDILSYPDLVGGPEETQEVLLNYFNSNLRNTDRLIEYCIRQKSGAVFKRLGYFLSVLNIERKLQNICKKHLTKGAIKLSPKISNKTYIKEWRLYI